MSETPTGDALAVEPATQEQPAPETKDDGAQTTPETTTDEAEADKSAETRDEDQDETEEPKRKRPSGSERLRRENERLRAELASRSAAHAAGDDIARAVEAEIGAPPKEDDYKGDFLAWERALTAYETEKRIVSREVKARQAEAQRRAAEVRREAIADHQDRVADLVKSHPEMREKFNKPLAVVPNDTVRDVLLDSDKSELLLAYFIDHPKAVAELNDLGSERAIARRIGQLEKSVSPPKPKPTQAPPPIKPPTGAARPGFDPFKASTAEIAKYLKAKGQMY